MSAAPRHLLHVFQSFDPGGIQMRAVQLMGMLGAECRHSVVAMDGGQRAMGRVPEGVRLDLLPIPPAGSFWAMGGFFKRLIQAQHPDLLLTYNWGAIEALLGARRAGDVPLVHHEDGFGPEEVDAQLRRRIWTRRLLLRRAARVVVPSRLLEESAARDWWVPRDRICYLPNGVDLQRFHPAEHPPAGPLRIVSVGHLRPEKDQATLIRALAALPAGLADTELHLLGAGPEHEALGQLAAELGLAARVILHGLVADPAAVYRDMHLFALSSRTEQMPLTVLEAMASGLPVVSTRVGDVAQMLPPGQDGNLVPRGDPGALAAALGRLLHDEELRRTQGRQNRAHAEVTYDRDLCYQAWVDLYRSLLPQKVSPKPISP